MEHIDGVADGDSGDGQRFIDQRRVLDEGQQEILRLEQQVDDVVPRDLGEIEEIVEVLLRQGGRRQIGDAVVHDDEARLRGAGRSGERSQRGLHGKVRDERGLERQVAGREARGCQVGEEDAVGGISEGGGEPDRAVADARLHEAEVDAETGDGGGGLESDDELADLHVELLVHLLRRDRGIGDAEHDGGGGDRGDRDVDRAGEADGFRTVPEVDARREGREGQRPCEGDGETVAFLQHLQRIGAALGEQRGHEGVDLVEIDVEAAGLLSGRDERLRVVDGIEQVITRARIPRHAAAAHDRLEDAEERSGEL